ncbi:MAG: PH domain-containing protein [Magnetococcales bacterium]|nr:PH domain-containing protein [Magnetococcales bacterium]
MKPLKQLLRPEEVLITRALLHWGVYLPALLLTIPLLHYLSIPITEWFQTNRFDGLFLIPLAKKKLHGLAIWFPLSMAAYVAAFMLRESRQALLTSRGLILMHRFGARHIRRLRLEQVRKLEVEQGAPGRLLHYGHLHFTLRDGSRITIPRIFRPERFQARLQARLELLPPLES